MFALKVFLLPALRYHLVEAEVYYSNPLTPGEKKGNYETEYITASSVPDFFTVTKYLNGDCLLNLYIFTSSFFFFHQLFSQSQFFMYVPKLHFNPGLLSTRVFKYLNQRYKSLYRYSCISNSYADILSNFVLIVEREDLTRQNTSAEMKNE